MDRFWKELALSVALSMVLPWLLLLISAKELLSRRPVMPDNEPPSAETGTILLPSQVSVETESVTADMVLEDYVLGVVMAEMPASFHPEALKAQAVVARTYALKRLQSGDRAHVAAVCDDPECCQAYISYGDYLSRLGTAEDAEKIRLAVAETAGIVLTYEGELIEATYFSCSGGKTEDAVAVWGEHIPYLQAVDSPGEEAAEKYWARKYISAAAFSAALERQLGGKPAQWLGAVEYTDGGGVATMVIGGVRYTGTELRRLLELDSTAFVMHPDETGITVETLGHGHRVGMSQYGADAMARAGNSWERILTYYYQGVVIDKGGKLG